MIENLFDIANDLLKSTDIVEVVSHYTKVEKKGRNYTALCPFHDDKKLGNFYISKEKGIFKCFACGAGGNAITFVEKIEHCTYKEAILKVAQIVGFTDERLNTISTKQQLNPEDEAIYKCLEDLSDFYQKSLFMSSEGKEALEYLHNRGLDDDIIKHFKIGYSQLMVKQQLVI